MSRNIDSGAKNVLGNSLSMRWYENGSEIIAEIIPTWPYVDPRSILIRPHIGPISSFDPESDPKHDTKLIPKWRQDGANFDPKHDWKNNEI